MDARHKAGHDDVGMGMHANDLFAFRGAHSWPWRSSPNPISARGITSRDRWRLWSDSSERRWRVDWLVVAVVTVVFVAGFFWLF